MWLLANSTLLKIFEDEVNVLVEHITLPRRRQNVLVIPCEVATFMRLLAHNKKQNVIFFRYLASTGPLTLVTDLAKG